MIIIIESFSLERLPPPPMLDRATLTLFFVFFRVDRFLIERRTLKGKKNTRDTTPCASR